MEYSQSGKFTDSPTAVVVNRLKPVDAHVTEKNGWIFVVTDTYQLQYKLAGGPFTKTNLKVTWKRGAWTPGQKDNQNLGGALEALDGVNRDFLPLLGEGVLSRSGYWLFDDSKSPLIDPTTQWIVEKPKPWSTDQYLFIYNKDYRGALKEYTRLLGSVPKIPRYALGCWYSKYYDYTDQELKDIVGEFRNRRIPLDVLVVDVDWHKYGWEGYDWNTKSFPDPQGFMNWCKTAGVKLTLNNHPSTIVAEDSHTPLVRQMLGLPPANEDYSFNFARMADAEAFSKICLDPLIKQGVTFWWIDGSRADMPGLNSFNWTSKVYYDNQEKQTNLRSFIFCRYGGIGSHRYPLGFSGDTIAQWETLRYETGMTARGSNVLWQWSHDIGGFHGDKLEEELMARWTQFGAFAPVLRLHSNHGERRPWAYEPRTESIMAEAMRLRERLIPYVYSLQNQLSSESVPVYRSLYMEDPNDALSYEHPYQYLVGSHLLVAPASELTQNGVTEVPVYLPKGKWMDYFTGHPFDGDRTFLQPAKLEDIPVFAKAGAIIPTQPDKLWDAEPTGDPSYIIRVYRGADNAFSLVEDDGLSLDYRKGLVAQTNLALKDSKDRFTFTIGARQGTFTGALPHRNVDLMVFGATKPKSVTVNGKPLKEYEGWQINPNTRALVISLGSTDVKEQQDVVVENPGGFDDFAFHARAIAMNNRLKLLASEIPSLLHFLEMNMQTLRPVEEGAGKPFDLGKFLISCVDTVKKNGASINQIKRIVDFRTSGGVELTKPFGFVDTVSGYASWDENLPKNAITVSFEGPSVFSVKKVSPSQSGFGRWQLSEPGESPVGTFKATMTANATVAGLNLVQSREFNWSNDFVTKWKLLGPFNVMAPEKDEPIFDDGKPLDFNKTFESMNGPTKWMDLPSSMTQWQTMAVRLVDFRKLWWQDQNHCYVATYLYSPDDRQVRFDIGSDDTFLLWVNRKLEGRSDTKRGVELAQNKVSVQLKKGWNEVVMRIGNDVGGWGLYFEVKTPDGKPDGEIKASTTPK
jgi:alpha-glucosidase (family GH31 glycosyl hydrolase)